MMHTIWQVHKFGGTSVGSAERYKGVAQIISDLDITIPPAIIVSAIKGVTDRLIRIAQLAQKKDDSYQTEFTALKQLHLDTLGQLLRDENRQEVADSMDSDFRDLSEVLRGMRLSGIAVERNVEFISGFGEIWSAQLLNALLKERGMQSKWLDARKILIVESLEKSVIVDWKQSSAKLNEWLKANPADIVVITGFVASTADGVPTTLKRNGSDYSASIFGVLMNAPEIHIWTDVDGIFSADPRLVPEAIVLDEISYNEAAELAYFGAKVVHPATMGPAMRKGIPIWIRNTFNPKHKGTKIHQASESGLSVKGLSVIDDMALLNLEGTGMAGVPGIAERLFASLSRTNVSVTMVSQAGSEHSICVAIPQFQLAMAKAAVKQTFYAEIHQGLIERVDVTPDCNVLAVVGDNMVQSAGVAGRFFRALGQTAINVKAIAQGSSERNISAVVSKEDGIRALRAVHSAFYLSDQTLSVGIIGTGAVGGTLLNQLHQRIDYLKTKRKVDLRIRGILNSTRMVLDERQVRLEDWPAKLQNSNVTTNLEAFENHLRSGEFPHSVIIDVTGSEDIAQRYSRWLDLGFNIITANKKANTRDQEYYDEMRTAARRRHKYYVYSTNVGAGLPIIQTLRDLHQTGDTVLGIEGVLSGTLSYLFNCYTSEQSFSEVVKEAKNRGYTEPDPRDDLSGMDVARKLVILAREIDIQLELADVAVENLVPDALQKGTVEEFMKNLPKYDVEMKARLGKAKAQGEVLRYVATLFKDGKAQVKLERYSQNHPFARISGSDNIVAFRTDRYDRQPLIIQGPGAGPQVTAAGVFADLLRLASYLGASL
jgi:bifunctional aspartokinase / homoserine dehydrogenase 1